MPKMRRIMPEELAQIRDLYATGLGYKGVGLATGRHWTTIRSLIPPHDRRTTPGKAAIDRDLAVRLYTVDGWSLQRICDTFRCKHPTLKKAFGPEFEYRTGNKPSPALDRERTERRNENASQPKPVVECEPAPTIDYRDPRVPSVFHLIDFKRAGHTAAWYRENCEISELEDMRERRRLLVQPRPIVASYQDRFFA